MSTQKKSMIVEGLRKAQMAEVLSRGKRLDGRGLLDYRPITIETGMIERASGSAMVTIGNTQVIVGVMVQTGTPFPDTPDKGLLVVNAEVLPLASPYAEPGPPDEDAIELARVVDRGVRESQMIDLSKLVLIPGKQVYAVFADIGVLNVDGNLFDAASYAVVASLLTSTMKKFEVTEDGQIKETNETIPVPTQHTPISVTMARIGDAIMVDPTSEEEAVMDARITLACDEDGNLCAGQKGQPGTFAFDQIKLASEIARTKAKEVQETLTQAIKKNAQG